MLYLLAYLTTAGKVIDLLSLLLIDTCTLGRNTCEVENGGITSQDNLTKTRVLFNAFSCSQSLCVNII